MTHEEKVKLAILALADRKSDDSARARIFWSRLSDEELDKPNTCFGSMSKREAIQEWNQRDKDCNEVIAWLKSLTP